MNKPFNPEFLPIKLEDKNIIKILRLEAEARAKVEKFNSILERSIIKNELLMLFSFQESLQSTKIEGTQASLSEVVEAEVTGIKNKDIIEVLNYVEALYKAEDLLKANPISTRMFLQLHKIILKDSRGESRSPGEYRKIQNFIGPTAKIEDASYIPPEPQLINQYMGNLERYINDEFEDSFGPLSRIAIIHGQFETIHPFLDGNGRLGRILIIIYLLEKKIISSPSFFVSEELEKNKFKYYALLNGLRLEKPRWQEWVEFFLNCAIKQAEKYIEKLVTIEALYDSLNEFAKNKRVSNDAVLFIFNRPAFSIKLMEKELGISYNTASRYTHILAESGKIYGDDKKRNKIYRFYDLIDVL
jgi:Fic family protein